ncbi:MAG: AtpZ/AtpI family protein [Gloeobacterales cyanobacterium]
MNPKESSTHSLAGPLSLVAILGWSIVMPILVGVFAGKWLQAHYSSGPWTLCGILLGLTAGLWSAYETLRRFQAN